MTSKSWYSVTAAAKDSGVVEVAIFDDIGYFGITAENFRNDVIAASKSAKTVRVRINSYGGEVWQAIAMYHTLRGLDAKVQVVIDGIAASAASLVAMAGDEILIPENAYMMIHNPAGLYWGEAEGMSNYASMLEKLELTLANIYSGRTGLDVPVVREIMKTETWLTAAEAVSKGFADEMTTAIRIAANGSTARFKSFPEQLRKTIAMTETTTVITPVAEDNAKRVTEIVTLCKLAGKPEMAAELIGKTVDEARSALEAAKAADEAAKQAEIDAAIKAKSLKSGAVTINTAEIYNRWNGRR